VKLLLQYINELIYMLQIIIFF